jgi:hypothetical protein
MRRVNVERVRGPARERTRLLEPGLFAPFAPIFRERGRTNLRRRALAEAALSARWMARAP